MVRRDSAFAVIRRRARVLLVKVRETERWQLPGGSVEPGEAPWHAALREVREETGMKARILGLTGLYRRADGSLAFAFAARVPAAQDPKGPRNEIEKQKWFSLRKAMRLLSKAGRRRLRDALKRPALFRLRRASASAVQTFALQLYAG